MANKKLEPNNELGTVVPSLTSELGTRINAIAPLVGGKPALADMAGISESQLHRIVSGSSQAKIEQIALMARAAHLNIQWLATGEGPKFRADNEDSLTPGAGPSDEYAYLPLYDVRAAAGHGSVVENEEVVDSLAFKKQWIHTELHANPADLYLLYVHGDSMEPALRAGDVVLVNRRCSDIQHDGIYILVMDGTLLVKRLQSLPGGRIRVTSDNSAYQAFELEKQWLYPEHQNDAEGAGVIGRVVWAGRRM